MDYAYPNLIADQVLKRLHIPFHSDSVFAEEIRAKCDIADNNTFSFPFMEAVRLINEEGYRPCGNCLMEGGETSNWKERAERAEADVRGLQLQVEQSDALAADWKGRAEAAEGRLNLAVDGEVRDGG